MELRTNYILHNTRLHSTENLTLLGFLLAQNESISSNLRYALLYSCLWLTVIICGRHSHVILRRRVTTVNKKSICEYLPVFLRQTLPRT